MLWVGTSGYNYPEWRGSFYPEGFPEGQMLPYYAARFSTVEINYSFYRLPTVKALQGWADATPDAFRLTLKAPRRITHDSRLKDCEELTRLFCERAGALGSKLGVLLFQTPPSLRKNIEVLDSFLAYLPAGVPAAFEFRHKSWLDEEVYRRLRDRNLALCIMDSEDTTTPLVTTADYAYFRLRDEGYRPEDIARWAEIVQQEQASCKDVFVYFKHEEAGKGPEFARQLLDRLGVP